VAGTVIPALAYLGLALGSGAQPDVLTPLYSAAQFYTTLALLISAPLTLRYLFGIHTLNDASGLLAFRILQSIAVLFYAASAWIFKSRGLAHASAWLSMIPFTLSWKIYDLTFTPLALVLPAGRATLLLVIGFFWTKPNSILTRAHRRDTYWRFCTDPLNT
jgi:hypothetical protein